MPCRRDTLFRSKRQLSQKGALPRTWPALGDDVDFEEIKDSVIQNPKISDPWSVSRAVLKHIYNTGTVRNAMMYETNVSGLFSPQHGQEGGPRPGPRETSPADCERVLSLALVHDMFVY
jgi:hypothetical protein